MDKSEKIQPFIVNENFTYEGKRGEQTHHIGDSAVFDNFDNDHQDTKNIAVKEKSKGKSQLEKFAALAKIEEESLELDVPEENPTAQLVSPSENKDHFPTPDALPEWVSRIRDDAWHRGFDSGTKNGQKIGERNAFKKATSQAEENFHKAHQDEKAKLLENLCTEIGSLVKNVADREKERDIYIMELMLDIIEKILPTIINQHSEDEITCFLKGIVKRLNLKRKINITLPVGTSHILDQIKILLKDAMPEEQDLVTRINFLEETSFGSSDCKVSWNDGCIERNVKEIWQELNQTLRQHDPDYQQEKEMTQ